MFSHPVTLPMNSSGPSALNDMKTLLCRAAYARRKPPIAQASKNAGKTTSEGGATPETQLRWFSGLPIRRIPLKVG